MDDMKPMSDEAFSYVALGAVGVQAIRAHGVAFATVAQLYDDHPVWDAVIELLSRFTEKLPPEPEQPPHLRLAYSAD